MFGTGTQQSRVLMRRGWSGTRDGRPPWSPSLIISLLALSGGGGQIVTTATKVVLKPLEAEQPTAAGRVIPDTAKEKPQEGEVLAVGPGRFDDAGAKRVPMDVSVGDIVLYSKYGGTEVKYSGEEYLVLSARDVLAVIEK